jgi:hypothetical protein
MKQRSVGTKYVWMERPKRLPLPVTYVDSEYESEKFARAIGYTRRQLSKATEAVIRSCHHAAVLHSLAKGLRPEVYRLGIGPLVVFYTIESQSVVVRGYGGNLPQHERNPRNAGGLMYPSGE